MKLLFILITGLSFFSANADETNDFGSQNEIAVSRCGQNNSLCGASTWVLFRERKKSCYGAYLAITCDTTIKGILAIDSRGPTYNPYDSLMPSIHRFNFYWDEDAFNKLEALNKAVTQASMSESCSLESRSYALSCRSDLETEINAFTSDDEFKEKLQQAVDQ